MVGEEIKNKKFKSQRSSAIKTNYPGLYYHIDTNSKAKIWIARIKIGKIDTEQIVGRSDDPQKTNAFLAHQKRLLPKQKINIISNLHIEHLDV